ncbi:MAG: hypothetical protein FJZ38_04815 [Candidatus Rokubacteria bacterium]|nr:hypothetical protein [Candidatus Rokubacteria bacterium]
MSGEAVVRLLAPGDETHVEALLARHPDSSLFLRRNLAAGGVVDREARYHGSWAGAFETGRLVAVAQHTRFGTVLVQAPVHVGAVASLAARASGRAVSGFVGPWTQVGAARTALGLDGVPMRVESHEGLYALSLDALVVPEMLASGRWRCRRSSRDDVDLLVDWRVAYTVEANHEADDPQVRAWSREEIETGLAERTGFVLETDGARSPTSSSTPRCRTWCRSAACGHRRRGVAAGTRAPSSRGRCSQRVPKACRGACCSRARRTSPRSARTRRSATGASATGGSWSSRRRRARRARRSR